MSYKFAIESIDLEGSQSSKITIESQCEDEFEAKKNAILQLIEDVGSGWSVKDEG